MLIFKDVFTDDELSSDSFPMKLVDDLVYEFKGRHVVRKEGDIVLEGSNPSAEGGEDDGSDEHVERGIDIVLNHKLVEMNCYEDASMFKSYIKGFMKKTLSRRRSKDGLFPYLTNNALRTSLSLLGNDKPKVTVKGK
ncbi:unnamed protein product [Caenorhabditis auriculariae]|uniref:Translationally-controlled tumor protein homolog n=1 Tax=Caenorhabditis auriculariae TaxID=2777116 RepID=A0A8S1HE13_9PELO|nr:unnamed protein product [Caenorhabditis auriculariae]